MSMRRPIVGILFLSIAAHLLLLRLTSYATGTAEPLAFQSQINDDFAVTALRALDAIQRDTNPSGAAGQKVITAGDVRDRLGAARNQAGSREEVWLVNTLSAAAVQKEIDNRKRQDIKGLIDRRYASRPNMTREAREQVAARDMLDDPTARQLEGKESRCFAALRTAIQERSLGGPPSECRQWIEARVPSPQVPRAAPPSVRSRSPRAEPAPSAGSEAAAGTPADDRETGPKGGTLAEAFRSLRSSLRQFWQDEKQRLAGGPGHKQQAQRPKAEAERPWAISWLKKNISPATAAMVEEYWDLAEELRWWILSGLVVALALYRLARHYWKPRLRGTVLVQWRGIETTSVDFDKCRARKFWVAETSGPSRQSRLELAVETGTDGRMFALEMRRVGKKWKAFVNAFECPIAGGRSHVVERRATRGALDIGRRDQHPVHVRGNPDDRRVTALACPT